MDGPKRTDEVVAMPLSEERASAARASMEEGVRARAVEPPPLALRRTSVLEGELRELGDAIGLLRERMARYGTVTTSQGGWRGRLELGVKRLLRRLVQRHLDQEKEVHDALGRVLEKLGVLLAVERDLLDHNSAVLTEDAIRRDRRARES